MRIDPQIPAAENSGTNRVSDSQLGAAKKSSGPPAAEPSDTVQLSSDQATVRQLISQLSQVPDVRQGLVEALRSEIQSGQFQRSSDQVAGAIVSQLLGGSAGG
jgi:flagellar biosynthesis anti-sigma factor FlgM